MPVAERLGLVRLLDQRVLELVIEEMAAHRDLKASLNVSASSTMGPDWWSRLEALLRLHDHVAARLIIEITETAAIHDIDNARGFVSRVRDLGARIAIDDFGAGYTSFRNLRKLGVDMIKIDGAFIEKLVRSDDDRAFVRAMIDLGRRLNMKTVAEWVQDEEICSHSCCVGLRLSAGHAHWLRGARPSGTGCVLVAAAPNLAVAHKLESNPDLGNQLDCNRRLLLLRGNRGAMPLAVNPCR